MQAFEFVDDEIFRLFANNWWSKLNLSQLLISFKKSPFFILIQAKYNCHDKLEYACLQPFVQQVFYNITSLYFWERV